MLDWAGCDMYDRKAYAASLTFVDEAWLIAPDHPPKAANGAWLTPLVAYGHSVGLQSTSCLLERSYTCFEPGRMMAPTLSMTLDCDLSVASGPMSPQSSDSAQRPVTNRPRESPTSLLSWSGGPSLLSCL